MGWNPYQDQKNRAYSSILTTLFPEQTKTIPRLIVWSFIFLADLTSAERDYPDVQSVRDTVEESLDAGMKVAMEFIVGKLRKNQQPICRDSWLCYQCYVGEESSGQ